MSDIIICLLAHAGITQPSIWERYRQYAGGRVGFAVYTWPQNRDTLPQEWRQYAVQNPVESRWGELSIVHATQQLFGTALRLHPRGQLFVLLPGNSIPCCSLQTLDAMVNSGKYYIRAYEEPSLPDSSHEIYVMVGEGYRKVGHSQFLALARRHAAAVENMDIATWFDFNEGFLKIGCPTTPTHYCAVPDEYVIGVFLGMTFEDDCAAHNFDEICFWKMKKELPCPGCGIEIGRAETLSGDFLRACLQFCVKHKVAIAIRKISADTRADSLWRFLAKLLNEHQQANIQI